MRIVGITGGIGSGKTTVCALFECLNIPVFYADQVAKHLMATDLDLRNQVMETFGESAYLNGQLNRPFLAKVVFGDEEKLKQLNAIVHPAVGAATIRWQNENHSAVYGLKEAAILFESGSYRYTEKVISVWAPKSMRIKRVVARDGVSEQSVERRIDNQISEALRLSLSDYVIENDGNQLLIPQVLRIHDILSKQFTT